MADESAASAAIPGQQGRASGLPSTSRLAVRPGVSSEEIARPAVARPAIDPPRADSASVRGGPARETEAVRGEHVHSEPPAPRVPRRHSVRAQVLAALREALLSGELVPGEVYSAPALATRFGVSATPVREAMQRLASEGAVETVPNRGFRVAERTSRELAELAEVRTLLEVPVVLAIARSQPVECWQALRPLATAAAQCALRGDLAGYVLADQAFHRALVEREGNHQLTSLVGELSRRAQRQAVRPDELRSRASLHEALVEALGAGDLAAAEAVLREKLAG